MLFCPQNLPSIFTAQVCPSLQHNFHWGQENVSSNNQYRNNYISSYVGGCGDSCVYSWYLHKCRAVDLRVSTDVVSL